MGKIEKPPVDIRYICRYSAEITAKLKDADWIERPPSGCLTNSPNDIAYITDFKSFEGNLDYSFNDCSAFFKLKKAVYKEWKEVEFIPYNTKYGINPEKIIEVLRILHGGYNAKIMGEVVLGFTPVTWWSAKPIIVFMPYKDDYAVFIVAPLMGSDGADLELESVTIDETISFVEPVGVPFYYDLKTQTIGYSYNDKIISVDEFKDEWNRKHDEYEKQLGKPPELKQRVDALTQYFFGGFGNNLTIISLLVENESKTTTLKNIFAWIKRKYEQIPFSELKKSPYYDDFKPLFEIKELIPKLEKSIEGLEVENVKSIVKQIAQLGRDYADTVGKYYKELTGKSLSRENIETRALLEYRSKEQIQEQARWLQEQGIEPNSFEKAAMEYYGVPWEKEPEERILKESTENGWLFKKILDGEYAGSLEIWVMGEGEYKIENMDVAPSFRRRGIASDLIEEVIKDFVPYNELKWGMQTEEGAKLKEALDKKYKIIEEEPWRRLMNVIKKLEKEHGLEVPLDDVIAIAKEEGIEEPEELIDKLKIDGILYSPTKGVIKRVEIEEPKYLWEEELISVGGEILPDETVWLYHATKEEIAKEIVKTGVLKTAPEAPKEYGVYLGSNPSVGFDYGDGTVVAIRVQAEDLELDDVFPGRRADFMIEAKEYKPVEIGEVINVQEMDPDELIRKYPKTESWVKAYLKEKPPAKEPWMMTKEEWIRKHIKNVDKLDKWVKRAELGENIEVSTTEIDESFPVGKVFIYGNIASTFPSAFDEPSKTIYINIDKPSDFVSEILNTKDKTIQVYYALLHEAEHLKWSLEGRPLNLYSPETEYEKYYSHPSEVAAREASDAFLRSLLDAHRKAIHNALKEGKPVPEEVLVDYRDLVREIKKVAPEPEAAIESLPSYSRKLVGMGLQSEPFAMPAGECVLHLSGIEGKQPNIALYPWHLGHVGNTPIAVYQSGQWRNYFDRKKLYPETDKLNDELQKIIREYKAELAEKDGEKKETPQETIAHVMKFKSYTGSRPDWQGLLQTAVNDVDMLKADRYDLMRATGKLLGYNLTPGPSNVGLDRWLAQQLANETGQSVLMIGGSVTVEPEPEKEVEKEELKAEIEKRIKPLEVPIEEEDECRWECDKQFKICIEGREGDKELCYADCEREYEDKDSEDYKRCIKNCDKEYEEGVEWCEKEGAECYDECEKEVKVPENFISPDDLEPIPEVKIKVEKGQMRL